MTKLTRADVFGSCNRSISELVFTSEYSKSTSFACLWLLTLYHSVISLISKLTCLFLGLFYAIVYMYSIIFWSVCHDNLASFTKDCSHFRCRHLMSLFKGTFKLSPAVFESRLDLKEWIVKCKFYFSFDCFFIDFSLSCFIGHVPNQEWFESIQSCSLSLGQVRSLFQVLLSAFLSIMVVEFFLLKTQLHMNSRSHDLNMSKVESNWFQTDRITDSSE